VVLFEQVDARGLRVYYRALPHDASRHRALLPGGRRGRLLVALLLLRELLLSRGTDVAQPPEARTFVAVGLVPGLASGPAPALGLAVPQAVRVAARGLVYI
jgi:hypothetical protein